VYATNNRNVSLIVELYLGNKRTDIAV